MQKVACQSSEFGQLPNGQRILEYTLSNLNGMSIRVINYGATLTSVQIPNAQGIKQELTLSFETLDDYLAHEFYFGATIGRVANRITNARFFHDEKNYFLSRNVNARHHLHGGKKGFDKVIWQTNVIRQADQVSVNFYYTSADGDQGYPGNLAIKVTYTLTVTNELKLNFHAETDRITPVDLTNHAYWNLAGAGNGTVLNHILQIFSDHYVVTDNDLLSTGKTEEVSGTPFDFREPRAIGERMKEIAREGYDLCYILPQIRDHQPQRAAKIQEPLSKRILEVFTTQPGLQFYTGNSLRNYPISAGLFTQRYGAFCMETQNLPGAVNYRNFPSPFLSPDEKYQHETIYRLIW